MLVTPVMAIISDCSAVVHICVHGLGDCFSLPWLVKHVKMTSIDGYFPWLHASNLGDMLDVLAISYVMLE